MTQMRVFVVTVWLSASETIAFRASVRPVEREEAVVFTDPALFASFLVDMDKRVSLRASQDMANPPTGDASFRLERR